MTTETRLQPASERSLNDRRRRFTVSEYHVLGETGVLLPEERTELIDGDICTMTPIGRKHTWSNRRLIQMVGNAAEANDAWLLVGDEILLDDFNMVQPDLSIVRPRDHATTSI